MLKITLPLGLTLLLLGGCVPGLFGGYTLSGGFGEPTPFALDDTIEVYVNGILVSAEQSEDGLQAPIGFRAGPGDTIYVRVRNRVAGTPCGVGTLYAIDPNGGSTFVTAGFQTASCDGGLAYTSQELTLTY